MKNALLWIAVVPGMILTLLVVTFITNLAIRYQGDDQVVSYTNMGDLGSHGISFYIIGYIIQPALIGGTMVFSGRRIAPSGKNITGWVSAGVLILGILFLFGFLISTMHGNAPWKMWVACLVSGAAFICGAITGARVPLAETSKVSGESA